MDVGQRFVGDAARVMGEERREPQRRVGRRLRFRCGHRTALQIDDALALYGLQDLIAQVQHGCRAGLRGKQLPAQVDQRWLELEVAGGPIVAEAHDEVGGAIGVFDGARRSLMGDLLFRGVER